MDMYIPAHWERSISEDGGVDTSTPANDADLLRAIAVDNCHRFHRRLTRYLGCAAQASNCLHDTWLRLRT